LRKICHERAKVPIAYAFRLPILLGALSFDKEASIIRIIKYKNPLPFPIITQPVVHQLEYIGLWILPSRDLDAICNISKALLKPGGIACVDPENPRFRRAVSSLVRVLDSKL
jgi:hypothetical protein